MPRKQDELTYFNDCQATQPSFRCIHQEPKDAGKCVTAAFPAVGTSVRFSLGRSCLQDTLWVSLFHLATQSTAFWSCRGYSCRWRHAVDAIWSGASEWPCQPSFAHTGWNSSMSPQLSTAAVIHPPVFSRPAKVPLAMWFTWLSSRSSSVESLFCYFAFCSLQL